MLALNYLFSVTFDLPDKKKNSKPATLSISVPDVSLTLSSLWKHTGACGVVVGYPLDTVKVQYVEWLTYIKSFSYIHVYFSTVLEHYVVLKTKAKLRMLIIIL